ncbi:MAG: hypothetical protein HC884_04325 [Chloroflexaceae bacterium]|nr:hypothetical protein [Chloroflexaceae bacterium]
MTRSRIFDTDTYKTIETSLRIFLNTQPDFLSARTANSPRATGDAIQEILSEHFQSFLGDECTEYSATFARRAMADFAFRDTHGFYYVVDIKTHRSGTAFNMPNITSVERIARFYEDDKNYFVVLMVRYAIQGVKVAVEGIYFVPVEFLSWSCLTVGALGWGQIQIANANVIHINEHYPRKKWMIELCEMMLGFYPRQIDKIGMRIDYFRRVREYWDAKKG